MLLIRQYRKAFGPDPLLVIPELELPKGLYWIRGINGSGKTSFLESLAGLAPFEGSVQLEECDLRSNRNAYLRKVGFAEAEPTYPGFLTGMDLIRFYCRAKKGDPETCRHQARMLELEPHLGQQTHTYSSGMLKKLSLVLSLTGSPSLVLLDEPLNTLDTAATTALDNIIRQQLSKGVSFCITSHQPLDLPGRILLLENKSLKEI